ncbi:MAG: cell division protein SepF [Candidatus Aenigmarchaeota archaeon]|nr:cell division protein SepF [Candidatus Aenigmarchaeota archaeon]
MLRGLLTSKEEFKEDDYIEIDVEAISPKAGAVHIKIAKINSYNDVERIQSLLRDGNVVLAKIKQLKEKDMSELKRAVEKLRRTCVALNGDIAGVDEDYIILTPHYARVAREEV